jgi:hypothetical protein
MRRALAFTLILLAGAFSAEGQEKQKVFVNGVALDRKTIAALEQHYKVKLQSGRFWYDAFSGLWGLEGGPTAGQMLPGLKLGGALRPDASGGKTGVFINRRELHELEVRYLQSQYGPVARGRYWLDSQGVGGFENGPAQFRLYMQASQAGSDWIRRTPGGTVGGSGDCFYYSHPNGSSVMTGNC